MHITLFLVNGNCIANARNIPAMTRRPRNADSPERRSGNPADWRECHDEHGRLRWARAQKYPTAVAAARAMGTNDRTYTQHENGTNGFNHEAVRYAAFFRVNLIWLLTGHGTPTGRSKAEDIDLSLQDDDRAKWLEYGELLRTKVGG